MLIIILVVGVGILMFIYYSGKKAGKTKGLLGQGKPEDLPNSGSGIPKGWNPDSLVGKLFAALDGVDWFSSNDDKTESYGALVSLTDDQIVAVYNRFNQLHGKAKDGQYQETLYMWIQNDNGDDSKIKALAALEKLGLK